MNNSVFLSLLSNKMVSLPFRYSIVGGSQRDLSRYSATLGQTVIPECFYRESRGLILWIPAFARMTTYVHSAYPCLL